MKSRAEIQEFAKKIVDEFTSKLKVLEGKEFELYSEPIENMRSPINPPEKDFKEKMMSNFPKSRDGEPLMERKKW